MSEKNQVEAEAGNSESTVIVCEEVVDIRRVEDMKNIFDDAILANKPVKLQADKIERADTAGLQLLCAFFKDARASGMNIEWVSPSDALKNSAGLLGFTKVLELV